MTDSDPRTAPIGVFDSGMGGLTVLKALRATMPHERFIYLGDTARLPYGTKSIASVQQYARQVCEFLAQFSVKCLVIACNTASMAATRFLRQQYPELPIIGVIEPGASAALQASAQQAIMITATETTVASNIYQQRLQQLAPNAHVHSLACNLWVALAEAGVNHGELARLAVAHYLPPPTTSLFSYDCLLLGCTHFPVLREVIAEHVGPSVSIVDSAQATAIASQQLLQQQNLLAPAASTNRQVQFMVTDSPARFSQIGQLFLGEAIEPTGVELVNLL